MKTFPATKPILLGALAIGAMHLLCGCSTTMERLEAIDVQRRANWSNLAWLKAEKERLELGMIPGRNIKDDDDLTDINGAIEDMHKSASDNARAAALLSPTGYSGPHLTAPPVPHTR